MSETATEHKPLTASEVSELALTLVEGIRSGTVPEYEAYMAEHQDARIEERDFRAAILEAEQKAAGIWGFGPEKERKQLSKAAWEKLPLLEQAEFIRSGGTLFDLPTIKDDPAKAVITNRRGERMLQSDFNNMSPKARMDWCVTR